MLKGEEKSHFVRVRKKLQVLMCWSQTKYRTNIYGQVFVKIGESKNDISSLSFKMYFLLQRVLKGRIIRADKIYILFINCHSKLSFIEKKN